MSEAEFINYILVSVLGAVVAIIILHLIRGWTRLVGKYILRRLAEKAMAINNPDHHESKKGIATTGYSPASLFYFAAAGDLAAVEKLIFSLAGTGMSPQRLSLISQTNQDGLTAADVAEQSGHQEIAKLLRSEQGRMEFFE